MNKEDLEKEIVKGNVSPIAFYNPGGSNMLYTQKYVEQKDKEIERLNNIINRLEKWLDNNSRHKELFECDRYYQEILNKLKELKEGKQ